MTKHYSISKDVFEKFPEFRRGVVVATGLSNPPACAELTAAVREAEAADGKVFRRRCRRCPVLRKKRPAGAN